MPGVPEARRSLNGSQPLGPGSGLTTQRRPAALERPLARRRDHDRTRIHHAADHQRGRHNSLVIPRTPFHFPLRMRGLTMEVSGPPPGGRGLLLRLNAPPPEVSRRLA